MFLPYYNFFSHKYWQIFTVAIYLRLNFLFTTGSVSDYYLHQKLILIDVFHSHLENLNFLSIRNIDKQVRISVV